jgi:hypothetical protein
VKSWTTVAAVLGAFALALPGAADAQAPYPLDCEDLGGSKVTRPGPFKALPQQRPPGDGQAPLPGLRKARRAAHGRRVAPGGARGPAGVVQMYHP